MEEEPPQQDLASEFSDSVSSQQIFSDEEGADTSQGSIGEVSDSSILSQDIFSEEEDSVTQTNNNPNKMSISVDFLAPKPIQDGADLSNQWTRFKEEFELFLTAAEKSGSDDKIKVAIMLRCIGPRGNDIFKSFTFTGPKSKDKYDDVIEKFDAFCNRGSNKVVKRHQLLSTKQNSMSIDEYITSLHNLARESQLDTMYDDFMLQALLLGINDDKLREKLFNDAAGGTGLSLEDAIKKCRISESSKNDMAALQSEESVKLVSRKKRSKQPRSVKEEGDAASGRSTQARKPSKGSCGNCGQSHPPRKCPAYGQQCHTCKKYNHWKDYCRSKRQVNVVAEESDDSDDSLLCIQVVRRNKKLMTTIKSKAGDSHKEIQFQIDTGASCNILNYRDYADLGKPALDNNRSKLKQFDGSITTALGGCDIELAGENLYFLVHKTRNHSLLSGDASIQLGLISIKEEWVNLVCNADLDDIISSYPEVFEGIGCLPGEYHIEIDKDAVPRQSHNRKTPLSMMADLKEKLESYTKKGILAPVDYPTEWISNNVSVRKPNGTLRVCLDPSNLNKVIQRNHFPMPTLDDVLSELDGARVFSLCDAKDGFLQIKLSEKSSDLTTFWTPFGKYKWLRMPFGLSSSPEEFQRRLSDALSGLKGVTVVADDILIYGKGSTHAEAVQDHNLKLEKLLTRARRVNLKLNKDKCKFLMKELPYIGHLITNGGVKADPGKIRAITEMKAPIDSDGVRRFLGHVNYLAKFVPNCSAECEPLRRLVGVADKDFIWGPDQERAFKEIKSLITATSSLKYFNVHKPVVVQTDASTEGLGAVLLQDDQPVSYGSRSLTDSEKNYAPIELELLAIVYGLQKFDQYVFGNPDVTVHTDHRPLEPIFQKPLNKAPKRLQSMLLALQRYPVLVQYKPGAQQITADMLSRAPVGKPTRELPDEQIFTVNQLKSFLSDLTTENLKTDLPVSEPTYKMIREQTNLDAVMRKLQQLISSGWPQKLKEVPEEIKPYHSYKDELAVLDGIIYKGSRLVVPMSVRQDILKKLHISHQGTAATIRRARSAVFWPQMAEDIRMKTEKCVTCALDTPMQQPETLQSHDIPGEPWKKVGMDILTYKSRDYLILVDYFSDFFECEQLADLQSRSVIKACKKTFSRYGIPTQLQSDNGTQFVSAEFDAFRRDWGFQHTTSSPGHQQSNGKAEAAVKIVKRLMKRADDPYLALLEYRNTPTSGMTSSPTQRMFGRATRSILPTGDSFENQVIQQKYQRKMVVQKHFNKSARDLPNLTIGMPVLLRDFQDQKNKWQQGRVVEQLSDRSYLVSNDRTEKAVRRNRVDLRPIVEAEPSPQESASPVPVDASPLPVIRSPEGETAPEPSVPQTPTSTAKTSPAVATWKRSRQTKTPAKLEPYVLY